MPDSSPPSIIDLNDVSSWPADVLACLAEREDVLRGWNATPHTSQPHEYDRAIYALRRVIAPHFLVGLHCTRLTEAEMECILRDGMDLPDGAMLTRRIEALRAAGLVDTELAERMRTNHLSDDEYRSGRIWFCFFEPGIATEWGIGELLGLWGGEALYRGVASDERLKCIGLPCLVEAMVRIGSLRCQPDMKMADIYLKHRGVEITEPTDYAGCTMERVPADRIRRVIRFPSEEFRRLTGCDGWDEPLMSNS